MVVCSRQVDGDGSCLVLKTNIVLSFLSVRFEKSVLSWSPSSTAEVLTALEDRQATSVWLLLSVLREYLEAPSFRFVSCFLIVIRRCSA